MWMFPILFPNIDKYGLSYQQTWLKRYKFGGGQLVRSVLGKYPRTLNEYLTLFQVQSSKESDIKLYTWHYSETDIA